MAEEVMLAFVNRHWVHRYFLYFFFFYFLDFFACGASIDFYSYAPDVFDLIVQWDKNNLILISVSIMYYSYVPDTGIMHTAHPPPYMFAYTTDTHTHTLDFICWVLLEIMRLCVLHIVFVHQCTHISYWIKSQMRNQIRFCYIHHTNRSTRIHAPDINTFLSFGAISWKVTATIIPYSHTHTYTLNHAIRKSHVRHCIYI